MPGQGGVQAVALGHVVAHRAQQLRQRALPGAADGDVERLQQRQPGLQHGRQLAREEHELLVGNAARQAPSGNDRRGAGCRRAVVGAADARHPDAVAPELRARQGRVIGRQHAALRAALAIQALPVEARAPAAGLRCRQ
ncbi:hypothetical protein Herbaro_01540 [Herbaspirillum sp. WKF16]|uniref:hypothetical protein n=1 Tax=Herbaspirillum sp. WKF16 TaxID=3028312 RepID=UPI0023A9D6A3|nr:hypothetical protein [Herbaspirillum sp. WKF16]WDZ98513.1 hypothetical protein Herbaro_01540 [Herbaspirillum sp. WKF16]